MPAGVEISTGPGRVTVSGPKGSLEQEISPDIAVAQDGDRIVITRPTDRADHHVLDTEHQHHERRGDDISSSRSGSRTPSR